MAKKKQLIEFVEKLLESPKEAVIYSVNNVIKEPSEVLRRHEELYFDTQKIVSLLEGSVKFPSEYIQIKQNVPFDEMVPTESRANRFKKAELHQPIPVKVFKSKIQGKGVKVLAKVPRRKFIMDFLGEVISSDEATSRKEEIFPYHYIYELDEHAGIMLDAYYFGNEARFLNHSCEPNWETLPYYQNEREHLGIFSIEAIKKNQELTIDYKLGDEAFLAMGNGLQMRC